MRLKPSTRAPYSGRACSAEIKIILIKLISKFTDFENRPMKFFHSSTNARSIDFHPTKGDELRDVRAICIYITSCRNRYVKMRKFDSAIFFFTFFFLIKRLNIILQWSMMYTSACVSTISITECRTSGLPLRFRDSGTRRK